MDLLSVSPCNYYAILNCQFRTACSYTSRDESPEVVFSYCCRLQNKFSYKDRIRDLSNLIISVILIIIRRTPDDQNMVQYVSTVNVTKEVQNRLYRNQVYSWHFQKLFGPIYSHYFRPLFKNLTRCLASL